MVLKKKYRQPFLDLSPPKQGSPLATPDLATPVSPLREPPPYRPPPPAPLSPSSNCSYASLEESATSIPAREKNDDLESVASVSSVVPPVPPVPPRRKSQDKLKENKENVDRNRNSTSEAVIKVGSSLIISFILKTYSRPLSRMSSYLRDLSRDVEVSCR